MEKKSSQDCQFYKPKKLNFNNIYEISGSAICECKKSYYYQKKCPFIFGGTYCDDFKLKKGKMDEFWNKYKKIIDSKKYTRYKIRRDIEETIEIINAS